MTRMMPTPEKTFIREFTMIVVASYRLFIIVSALLSVAVVSIHGYSDHAGTCIASSGAVSAMSSTTATGNGGFSISPSQTTYTSGQTLTVTISGGTFRGFLLYGVDGSGNRVGSFNTPSGSQILSGCGGASSATVCHTSSTSKTSMVFTWTPPAAGTGTVTFHGVAVVLQNQWYILDNVQVTETGAPAGATTVSTSTTASTTAASGATNAPPTTAAGGTTAAAGATTKSASEGHSLLSQISVTSILFVFTMAWFPIIA